MTNHENLPQQAPPQAWATPGGSPVTPADKQLRSDGVTAALLTVASIQSRIPSWQRFVAGVETDAKVDHPDWPKIRQRFDVRANHLDEMLDTIRDRDQISRTHGQHGLTFTELLGTHAELLVGRLQEADSWWTSARKNARPPAAAAPPHADPAITEESKPAEGAGGERQGEPPATHPNTPATAAADSEKGANKPATPAAGDPANPESAAFLSDLGRLKAALAGALQHSLFLTFVNTVRNAHIGDGLTVDDHCAGWNLNTDQIDLVWLWLTNDPLAFGGQQLPVAVDTAHRCAYREASDIWQRLFYASSALWGAALIYGVIAGLFAILHLAGVWHYRPAWGWKLLVLVLFVSIGAWAHIGAKVVNVNYDNPISVYDAASKIDWLALRWLGVLQMYIPVGVVVASLWGAGNVPTSFQKLGTALLAGYSADSFMSAVLSKASSSPKQPAKDKPVTAPNKRQWLISR